MIVTRITWGVTLKGKGVFQISGGFTELERQRMDILLEPTVSTYADAAKRLGITEGAMKQTMARVLVRYSSAKHYCNLVEYWKQKRRELRKKK